MAPPSRRDGVPDRPTGHDQTDTARTSTIVDPVVLSDPRSGGSWLDRRGGLLRVSESAEKTSGRSTIEASRLFRP